MLLLVSDGCGCSCSWFPLCGNDGSGGAIDIAAAGGFIAQKEKAPDYVVPDLTNFKLKPCKWLYFMCRHIWPQLCSYCKNRKKFIASQMSRMSSRRRREAPRFSVTVTEAAADAARRLPPPWRVQSLASSFRQLLRCKRTPSSRDKCACL